MACPPPSGFRGGCRVSAPESLSPQHLCPPRAARAWPLKIAEPAAVRLLQIRCELASSQRQGEHRKVQSAEHEVTHGDPLLVLEFFGDGQAAFAVWSAR